MRPIDIDPDLPNDAPIPARTLAAPAAHRVASAAPGGPSVVTGTSTWAQLRRDWPLGWSDLGALVGIWVLLSAVFVGLGVLITGPLDGSVGDVDRRVARRLADGRTPRLDDLSWWGSMLSETAVKVVVTSVVVTVMVLAWKRWEDALLVAVSLIVEASAFVTITLVVGRERPSVPRLDSSPVDSSFPSGHVAAAVVSGAVVIVVARHARHRWPVVVALVTSVLVALAVLWARMYRGMHHLSDVVAGVLLGLASLALTWWVLRRAACRAEAP